MKTEDSRKIQETCVVTALLMTALSLFASGCGVTRNALPAEFVETAQPVGVPNVRAWGGRPSDLFQRDMVESIRQG